MKALFVAICLKFSSYTLHSHRLQIRDVAEGGGRFFFIPFRVRLCNSAFFKTEFFGANLEVCFKN